MPIHSNPFHDKTLMVTGGSGSFGQTFTKIALEHNPKEVRIFSRGELLQDEMARRFDYNPNLHFIIGDVRDRDRLYRAMEGVDIVVHAAALKFIPQCEYNPVEAIKTNIGGAINLIDAAIDNEVGKVFGLSTDKACMPKNLYGATKKIMEGLFIQANMLSDKTRFSCSRYGNVYDARGEVFSLFLKQKGKGILTITDPRMTRFWISIEEGVKFVISCIDRMIGGEIFLPKMPSIGIVDLADAIAPEAKKEIIGIRPGEKLHESLFSEEESRQVREFEDYFIIEPELSFWKKLESGQPTSIASYTSNAVSSLLTKEELKGIINVSP